MGVISLEDQKKLEALRNSNDITARLMGKNPPGAIQLLGKMGDIIEQLRGMEQGFIGLSNSVQYLSIELGAARLTCSMLMDVLVNKNIISKEDITALYETEVAQKMRKHIEDLQREAKEAAEAANNPQEEQKAEENAVIETQG